ncbi:MAG: 3-oxoacyl-[acyl-carrier-protein] reductase [Planctomycetaceae bacterium]|nr:3-oxoacyl-[acyl-carrier-protein] reductase [Planctomycetaceae bacterium]MBP61982.1 3-oxoacyl-[acyl-carrier-protein] reductase [Planctomycetaceae bacterium]
MAFSPSNEIRVDLSGQSAIVTGASQGLGRAIALRLGENGAHVACVARNPEKLTETVGVITAAGGSALAISCDVKDRNSVEAVVDQVSERWERVDILVNNAGITRDTLLPRMSDEEWDEVIETNLRGAFLFTRAASRLMMRARYGRIINMASVSGIMGNPGQTNYSASKAGLIGLTRSLSRELASRKVTINAIAPGFIASEMTEALGDAVLQEVEKRVPARRLGKAEEVADAVLYLSSVSAGYITGQVLVIDGGLTG